MSDPEVNIHVLDAAYKPFPTFAEWASRTSVDTVRWDRYNASLKERAGLSPEVLNRAREIAKRAAALDTGAIEGLYEVDRGFTYTVAFETAAWELELAKKGENVRPLFEAQLHAYDYVLDLATKAEPISEAAIRTLHEVVCRAQETYRVMTAVGPQEQTLTKGRYKVLPNHVRTRDGADHSYAPVDVTPAEMFRLVEELRSDAFLAAHSVLQATYAHYCLVVIHPFADGNGRVARALASAFTYRAISMPIVILSEQKEAYLDSLEAADRGDYQSFVNFMLARSLDTIQLVDESLQGARVPTPEESAAAISKLYSTRGGYSEDQVDEAGEQLLQLSQDELQKAFGKNANRYIHGVISRVAGLKNMSDSTHRRAFTKATSIHISFSTNAPAKASIYRQLGLELPKNASGEDDVLLVIESESGTILNPTQPKSVFAARMDELIPSMSAVLQIRVGLFAERFVSEMLSKLKPLAEQALRKTF